MCVCVCVCVCVCACVCGCGRGECMCFTTNMRRHFDNFSIGKASIVYVHVVRREGLK